MPADLLVRTRSVKIAVAAAGISSFALLYAPQPVLPQLAAQFHLEPGGASLAVSMATGALAVAVLPIAAVSELVGRRPVIMVSVCASVLLGLLLPLAPSYPALLVVRALQGIAIAGFPGVAAAYLVEQLGGGLGGCTPRQHSNGVAAAVGAMVAGNTLGGMLGRLSSGFSAEALGWRGALAAVAVLALLCSLVTVLTLPPSPPVERKDGARRSVLGGVGAALRNRVLLAQYAVALLGMGAFVAMYNAAGFRLTGRPLDLSPAVASLVFLCYAMGSVSSATAGRLVARLGRRRSVAGALAVTALGVVLTLPDSLPLVVAGFVVLTGGFFAAHAVANGWAAAQAPARARGQASGLYTLAYYLGSSIGGTAGSVVYGHAGWPWLVAVTASWLVLGIVCVRVLSSSSRKLEEASGGNATRTGGVHSGATSR